MHQTYVVHVVLHRDLGLASQNKARILRNSASPQYHCENKEVALLLSLLARLA